MSQAINLIIRAKDTASKTFTGAMSNMLGSLNKFVGAHPALAAAIGAVTAAIGGFVSMCRKGVAAYEKQHAAVNALATAHLMYGEDAKAAIRAEGELASAIQDETGVGDEVTLQRMARMKSLGMETRELGRAAKGVIALTKLGMSEEAAMRALVNATNGNYQSLERYVPALRTANTETEKADILNRQLANGYALAQADLQTFTGKVGALKGRIGDLREVVGQATIKFFHLREAADFAAEKTKDLTDWMKRVTGYAEEIPDVKLNVEKTDKIQQATDAVKKLEEEMANEQRAVAAIEKANEAIQHNIDLQKKRLELAEKNKGMSVKDYVQQMRDEKKAAKEREKSERKEQASIDAFKRRMKQSGLHEITDPVTGERRLTRRWGRFGEKELSINLAGRDREMWEAIVRKEADAKVRADAQKNIDAWKKDMISPVTTKLESIRKEWEEARKDLSKLLAAQ